MIKHNHCFKNQGFSGNQVAAVVVYLARQEVLNLRKARQIWPRELQLISRQTDREVKKLASIYRKQNSQRTEPFPDENIPNEHHDYDKLHIIVDLTKTRQTMGGSGLEDPTLMSPKANIHIEHYGSAKKTTAEKNCAVQSVPVLKKNATSGARPQQLSSQKGLLNSNVKQQLENAKHMPFRTKKQTTHPKVIATKGVLSCQTEKDKIGEQPGRNNKVRHFISAQKQEDGKVRLFAERRISQTNNQMESDTLLNLRMKTVELSKQLSVADNRNFHSNTGSANKGQLTHKLTSHKSTKSLAYGLKGSSRQDIYLGAQDSVNSGCMTTKNQTSQSLYSSTSQSQFKTKLQSKYGISAQNKMFANGTLKHSSKAADSSQSENKHISCSKEPKPFSRNQAQAFRNTTNLQKADESISSINRQSKYANPYIYHRKTTSKHLGTEAEEEDCLQKTSTFGGASDTQLKPRYRESSENAALQSREFKQSGATLPDLNGSRLCRKYSDYGAPKLSSSQESFHSKLRAPTILAPQLADGKNENSQQALL